MGDMMISTGRRTKSASVHRYKRDAAGECRDDSSSSWETASSSISDETPDTSFELEKGIEPNQRDTRNTPKDDSVDFLGSSRPANEVQAKECPQSQIHVPRNIAKKKKMLHWIKQAGPLQSAFDRQREKNKIKDVSQAGVELQSRVTDYSDTNRDAEIPSQPLIATDPLCTPSSIDAFLGPLRTSADTLTPSPQQLKGDSALVAISPQLKRGYLASAESTYKRHKKEFPTGDTQPLESYPSVAGPTELLAQDRFLISNTSQRGMHLIMPKSEVSAPVPTKKPTMASIPYRAMLPPVSSTMWYSSATEAATHSDQISPQIWHISKEHSRGASPPCMSNDKKDPSMAHDVSMMYKGQEEHPLSLKMETANPTGLTRYAIRKPQEVGTWEEGKSLPGLSRRRASDIPPHDIRFAPYRASVSPNRPAFDREKRSKMDQEHRGTKSPLQATYAASAVQGSRIPNDIDGFGLKESEADSLNEENNGGWSTLDYSGKSMAGRSFQSSRDLKTSRISGIDDENIPWAYRKFQPVFKPKILKSDIDFKFPMPSFITKPKVKISESTCKQVKSLNGKEPVLAGKKRLTLFQPPSLEEYQEERTRYARANAMDIVRSMASEHDLQHRKIAAVQNLDRILPAKHVQHVKSVDTREAPVLYRSSRLDRDSGKAREHSAYNPEMFTISASTEETAANALLASPSHTIGGCSFQALAPPPPSIGEDCSFQSFKNEPIALLERSNKDIGHDHFEIEQYIEAEHEEKEREQEISDARVFGPSGPPAANRGGFTWFWNR